MKNYIGIDWGKRKVGTAFGDDEMRIAFAGELFENDQKLYDRLISLAHDHDASVFVVGSAVHSGHSDNSLEIDVFVEKMGHCSALEIIIVDEMLTTRRAQDNLKQAGKKNIAAQDDVESARVLLQDFLDQLGDKVEINTESN